jgi:hypothetical protein
VSLPSSILRASDRNTAGGVPGYRIAGVLSRGGMGVAYKARHLTLKRTVDQEVIKLLKKAGAKQWFDGMDLFYCGPEPVVV